MNGNLNALKNIGTNKPIFITGQQLVWFYGVAPKGTSKDGTWIMVPDDAQGLGDVMQLDTDGLPYTFDTERFNRYVKQIQ